MHNRLKMFATLLSLMAGSATAAPAYNAAGDLIPPADYREWIFLSAGFDMSYSEKAMVPDHSVFDNVFVDPVSWAAFKQTGHWPDKTMMVLEIRGADSHGSINKSGQYQTEAVTATEIHIRDEARFKGGWGFSGSTGRRRPSSFHTMRGAMPATRRMRRSIPPLPSSIRRPSRSRSKPAISATGNHHNTCRKKARIRSSSWAGGTVWVPTLAATLRSSRA